MRAKVLVQRGDSSSGRQALEVAELALGMLSALVSQVFKLDIDFSASIYGFPEDVSGLALTLIWLRPSKWLHALNGHRLAIPRQTRSS